MSYFQEESLGFDRNEGSRDELKKDLRSNEAPASMDEEPKETEEARLCCIEDRLCLTSREVAWAPRALGMTSCGTQPTVRRCSLLRFTILFGPF